MALLYFPDRALDDDGNPMPFAKLYTRDNAAHSTPKVTYSDPDLAIGHQRTNPVVADDAGYFPQCYADESEEFYLLLVEAAGSPTAPYRTYADITALGGNGTGVFSRIFGDSRWMAESGDTGGGNLGTIISFGRASPNDTGGFVLEQGWDGTQGTKKRLNFAEVETLANLTVGGVLQVPKKGISTPTIVNAVPMVTARGSAAAALATDIPLDGGYEAWEIRLNNVVWSINSATLSGSFSFDNAATFKSGASEYQYNLHYADNGVAAAATAAATLIKIAPDFGNIPAAAMIGGDVVIRLSSKSGRSARLAADYDIGMGSTAIVTMRTGRSTGICQTATYGKATHFRISSSTGNLTFDYSVIGLP